MKDNPALLDNSGEHLDLLLATSEIGIWELDAVTGTALRNLRHDRIFGYDSLLPHWSAEIFLKHVVEEDRERVNALLTASLNDRKSWSFETRIRRADGVDRWISAKGMPKFSDKGEITKLIGHVIDITETKQNEDRLRLLSNELNHRVSNTFTIMNAMIRQTSKKNDTVEQFANTLVERLAALSRSNKVLIAKEAERSSLSEILRMQMDVFADWQTRISVTGNTSVWFSGEASEALAMIFHELLTNALRHGALSVAAGKVSVSITSIGRECHIRWAETDGPTVAAERSTGIGSTILQNSLRDEGTVMLDFAPQGLIFDIVIKDSFQRETPDKPTPAATRTREQGLGGVSFSGQRILVIEDDPIIGLDIADILETRGATVSGPFTSVANALEAMREIPDAALLDVNLGHETTDAIALQLSELSVPFLILSGQDRSDLGSAYNGASIISKPFREQDLVNELYRIVC